MILADTSAWIDFFANRDLAHVHALKENLIEGRAVVGDLVLVEVLQGFRNPGDLQRAERALVELPTETLCGAAIAPKAAANYRRLRRRGITVRGTIDVIIATWCIENRVALLHNDRDFEVFERELGLVALR
ncbi:MAG: ribonuclease VapC [Alphaproteobacteria bacterium]|nr:MAG: ribonuclease VapC [Alphaproteobacteria bacterium]